MSIIAVNTESERSVKLEGATLRDFFADQLKYVFYKLCYIYGINYNEAWSIFMSNDKIKVIKMCCITLTEDEKEK